MNKHQIEGRVQQAKGKTREVVGKITGDKSTELKGKAEKHIGKFKAKAYSEKDGAAWGKIIGEATK